MNKKPLPVLVESTFAPPMVRYTALVTLHVLLAWQADTAGSAETAVVVILSGYERKFPLG